MEPEGWSQGFGLSLAQQFEKQKMERDIDSCQNVGDLQSLAKQFLSMWMDQKAACLWVMKQNQERPPSMAILENKTERS